MTIPSLTLNTVTTLSDANIGYISPIMALDTSNNTVILASGCSTTTFCSLFAWVHLATDSAGVFSSPNLVVSGSANYQVCNASNPPGWGNYSGAALDPVDGTKLIFVGEYANSSNKCQWQTRIVEIQPSVINPPVNVLPASSILAKK